MGKGVKQRKVADYELTVQGSREDVDLFFDSIKMAQYALLMRRFDQVQDPSQLWILTLTVGGETTELIISQIAENAGLTVNNIREVQQA
jgi:hypothetical protein